MQQQIGGHFQQRVGDEKQPGRQAVIGCRQAELLVHLQRGKAEIHPVQISKEIAQHQKRNQPDHNPADRALFDFRYGGG
jgi:hypothetical protein